MSTATLGFEIRSDQATTATSNLDKMTAAAAQAEAAQQRLANASAGSNASMARIASGADAANATLARLVAASSAATQAQHGHNSALGIGNTQAMALTHVFRSFGEQMAMGIPITQAMTSELNHLTFAMSGEDGLLAAAKKAGPAILGFLTAPGTGELALIGSAFVGAGLAASAFFALTRDRAKSVEDVLKRHKEVIDEIAAAYPRAAEAAKKYEDQAKLLPQSVVTADSVKQAADEQKTLLQKVLEIRQQLTIATTNSAQDPAGFDPARLGKNGIEAFKTLAQQIEAGSLGAVAIQKRLGELRVDPNLSKHAHEFADELQESANKAAELEKRLKGANAAIIVLNNSRYPSFADIQPRQDYQDQNNASLTWLQRQQDAALAGIGARSPDQLRQVAMAAEAAKPSPDNERADVTQYKIGAAGALAYQQAIHALTEAQDQRKRSLDNTLASAQLDLALTGKTTAQVDAARTAFQLEAQVREAAARNGITSENAFQKAYGAEIALIKQKADELGKIKALQEAQSTIHTQEQDLELQRAEISAVGMNTLAHDALIESLKTEQLIRRLGGDAIGTEADKLRANTAAAAANAEAHAKASLQASILFDRSQILRNATDQAIASAQQGAGLKVDLNSDIANMMRYNMALQETKDTFKGFATDMLSSLEQGKSAWESLEGAAVNALTKIADKLLDRGLDDMLSVLLGGGGGDILGELRNHF